ncbi:MAG: hypothetical protein JRF27_01775 [Deltaproteobacteria bacterium]|nr:hypothetical protein [Deltaproteobacteria bacterium]MBW2192494.1 hypothetical protein [Deltaproteobacteria bacterium]
MAYWRYRGELSQTDRLRRSYYELLRDDLEQQLIKYSLIDSYRNFRSKNIQYPFVEKRELKPRARIPGKEYECQNSVLVIFIEDFIPEANKKYIRYFDVNKTTKVNLLRYEKLKQSSKFYRDQKYLKSAKFNEFLKMLLPVDYALLIQRDPASKTVNRYNLSHFHVRIDWPIADAAEDLAQDLRYISKDIYEKGDKYAEDIQKKYFEYFGLPVMVGGRRTAAIVAAQYLKRIPCITTVYAGSSESRALIRISERGVSKTILMKFTDEEVEQIAEMNNIPFNRFKKNYMLARYRKDCVCIFQATYACTSHARPPDDGKLREIKPDLNWLTVDGQYILPKPGVWKYSPISLNVIYT